MHRKIITRILIAVTLFGILTLGLVAPALAFDGRGHKGNVTISTSEVVNDDLYVTAETVVIDGTVKGDVVAFAKTITINGIVEGDLIAAGQDIIINGTVKDDIRMAGAALLIGEKASIGSDVIAAGASLETRAGSTIGQDVVFAGAQGLLAGDIARNLKSATGSLELRGKIGGDASIDVGTEETDIDIPNSSVSVPKLKAGLTFGPSAKIEGKLDYTSSKQMSIPEGAVGGKVTHSEPKPDEHDDDVVTPKTPAEFLLNSALEVVRTIASLILVGLLLVWLFPAFLKTATERVKAAPLPSLGWGIVYIAAFFFAMLIVTIATIIGAIGFGVLTLDGLGSAFVFTGLVLIATLIVGFCLTIGFVAQVIVSILGGQLILGRINPELAEHKYWPLLVGVVIYAIFAAIPILGSLVWWLVVLLGLGALWYLGQGMLARKPVVI